MTGYYTVSEFAAVTGKDPGNIRRLLINGTIMGEKAGRQWLIPQNTYFPADGRIKTGEYRKWRYNKSLRQKEPMLAKRLSEMCILLSSVYGRALDRVILYGSYARGEQTDDSDVDIALMIKDTVTESTHDKMLDIIVDFELELEKTLSVIQIDQKNYLEWRNTLPFYRNIDREGVILWKAA